MEEVKGGWRKLLNEELHNLYTSPSVIRIVYSQEMRSVGYVAHRRRRNTYSILVGE
jgi:hypothetical protein